MHFVFYITTICVMFMSDVMTFGGNITELFFGAVVYYETA
jgi:hypothetical protein